MASAIKTCRVISFSKLYNPFSRKDQLLCFRWAAALGQIFEGDAWINQIKRSNVYLKEGVELSHSLTGKWFGIAQPFWTYRQEKWPVIKQTTKVDSVAGALFGNNKAVYFPFLQCNFYNTIGLILRQRQKYIREPREKVILGSAWPTFPSAGAKAWKVF